jgi:hypothetical protein
MPTGKYELKGKKLPTTTQVIGRFKNATGLIIWSNQLGLQGLNYFDELKKAGNTGTALHDLAELYILKKEYELPDDPIAIHCFEQFIEWWDSLDCEVIWTEKKFTSKKLNVGGCPDLLVKKDGKYILVDFKTSKAVYSDMLIQLSCYAALIKENDGIEIDRAVIVRFPKDDDETEIKKFFKDDLAVGLKQFTLLRKAFDLDKDLNKILKGKK